MEDALSDPPRMREARGEASSIARDLLASAKADAPPSGARARARQRLDRALSGEGVTTHVSALSEGAAASTLAQPDLRLVRIPGEPPRPIDSPAAPSSSGRALRYAAVASSVGAAAMVATVFAWMLHSRPPLVPPPSIAVAPTPASPPAAPFVPAAPAAMAPTAAAPTPAPPGSVLVAGPGAGTVEVASPSAASGGLVGIPRRCPSCP